MKPGISVRRARPSDLDRILVIERAGFGVWAWDRKLFADYTRTCGELFLVALEGENVIGYSITCPPAGIFRRRAELVSIAVAAPFRGKGAADALMAATLRRLTRRGVTGIGLMVKVTNDRARAFYERHGFRRVRRVPRYYEDGEDGLLFHLDLPKPI